MSQMNLSTEKEKKKNSWTWRTDVWSPRGMERAWDGLGVWG